MSVPGIVDESLDGEEVATRVSLGGEDELFITSTKTIIYRSEGLLSDESIETFPHNADRLTVSEGRRKSKVSLEYPIDGTRTFSIPASRTDAVLHPVLAGVLSGNGITDADETVAQTYRFSELTLVITSNRLVKHIGEAVWDGDFEQYHYDDVTNLSFEQGSVATQVVVETDGRQQRIKAPKAEAADVSERLKRALFEYYNVDSVEELNETIAVERDDDSREDPSIAFGDGVDPLNATPPEDNNLETDVGDEIGVDGNSVDEIDVDGDSVDEIDGNRSPTPKTDQTEASTSLENGSDSDTDSSTSERTVKSEAELVSEPHTDNAVSAADSFANSGFEPATQPANDELLERLGALEETVANQTALLERQQETIEQLLTELRNGR